MTAIKRYLSKRAAVAGLVATAAMVWRACQPAIGEHSENGISEMLVEATGAVVEPGSFVWEPAEGVWVELWRGRRLLFVGTPANQEYRDIYRAWVRLTPAGHALSVAAFRNLTETPVGDDAGLVLRGSHAAYATAAFGRVQSVSVLDLHGIADSRLPAGLWDRWLTRITAFQQHGSTAGVGRTDLVMRTPPRGVRLRLSAERLTVASSGSPEPFAYTLGSGKLELPEGSEPKNPAVRAVAQMHGAKPLVLWGVDTVRAEVGPEPIAWLEQKVFGARDLWRRSAYSVFGDAGSQIGEAKLSDDEMPALDLSAFAKDGANWPPPKIPSLWQRSAQGEGQWRAAEFDFLPKLRAPEGSPSPPPYFFQTFIRPDPERPYSKMWLIAMDMRQLELGMQAGYEDPKPLAGPPGDGRLPEDRGLQKRVVATFNGAFKTTHGAYGMMVDRRVLIPPEPGSATVVLTQDGRVGLGTWPGSKSIPDEITSFRQNLDPLVANGEANPSGRNVWGWQIAGESVLTQRTAMCVTPAGHVYYAFAEEIDGPTLARGLRQAGCTYGVHLDMNPGHCAFVYTRIIDPAREEYKLRMAYSAMQSNPARYVRWSSKDFFYVSLRELHPTRPPDVSWLPDGGVQPPPAWLPGIFKAKKKVGTLEIELLSVERGRVDWRLRAGRREPTLLNAPPMQLELPAVEAPRVIAAIGLGHTTQATRFGLAFDGAESLPLRDEQAVLIFEQGQPPRLNRASETLVLAPGVDAVQLPWLAEEGELTASAQEHGANRYRSALCITPDHRILIASATLDSSGPLASLLLNSGCASVVELDRGSHHPGFVHRAGTPQPPEASYDTSVLYLLGRPPEARAFYWRPESGK